VVEVKLGPSPGARHTGRNVGSMRFLKPSPAWTVSESAVGVGRRSIEATADSTSGTVRVRAVARRELSPPGRSGGSAATTGEGWSCIDGRSRLARPIRE